MISKKIRIIITMVLINLCFITGAYAKVFVLIGPSGVGKSTLMKRLLASSFNSEELISYTTRPMRDQEENMKDYFFISIDEYKQRHEGGEFILSTEVHGNMYGISKNHINDSLSSDRNLICSLNTEAAKKLKSLYDKRVVTIFISPPSFDELKKRLTKRGEKKASLNIRLENAKKELKEQNSFDYKVINDDIGKALESLKKIFFSETT